MRGLFLVLDTKSVLLKPHRVAPRITNAAVTLKPSLKPVHVQLKLRLSEQHGAAKYQASTGGSASTSDSTNYKQVHEHPWLDLARTAWLSQPGLSPQMLCDLQEVLQSEKFQSRVERILHDVRRKKGTYSQFCPDAFKLFEALSNIKRQPKASLGRHWNDTIVCTVDHPIHGSKEVIGTQYLSSRFPFAEPQMLTSSGLSDYLDIDAVTSLEWIRERPLAVLDEVLHWRSLCRQEYPCMQIEQYVPAMVAKSTAYGFSAALRGFHFIRVCERQLTARETALTPGTTIDSLTKLPSWQAPPLPSFQRLAHMWSRYARDEIQRERAYRWDPELRRLER